MRDSMTHAEALAEEKRQAASKRSWAEFKKRFHADVFFGVVTKDGEWVDSAIQFHTAAHFAAMHEGYHGQTAAESIELLSRLTNSVVYSSLLEQMYNAGLIK